MKFRREIERKFTVSNYGTFSVLRNYVATLLEVNNMDSGMSKDIFWAQKGVDFVRLRENTKELTIKITDKMDIIDRVEENLLVTSFEDGYIWATAAFGEPKGQFQKKYTVFYAKEAIVSVYQVIGDGQERTFLEVEADTLTAVNSTSEYLKDYLELTPEYRSLYQVFFNSAAPIKKVN